MGDLLYDENIEYIEEGNTGDYLYNSDDDFGSDLEEVSNIVSRNGINRYDNELLDLSAIEKGGLDYEGKSDVLISSSDAVNNIRGVKSINIDNSINGYDSYLLFDGDISASWSVINLSDSINNYDLLILEYKYVAGNYVCGPFHVINFVDEVNKYVNGTGPTTTFNALGGFAVNHPTNQSFASSYVVLEFVNDTSFNKVGSSNVHVLKIYGLKEKQIVIPEPTPVPEQPTSSGNTIINNYYGCVSDNSLSYNIMNKPLNQYNTAESFCAFGYLFALGIGLYLLIRKVIFKWQ